MSFYSNLPTGGSAATASSVYPTIFEVVSSREIDDLLPASIRYILTNYWISRHPTRFSVSVNNYFDEWFQLVLKGLVEFYHINHYNSTFIDKFYGLQRFNGSSKIIKQSNFNLIYGNNSQHNAVQNWPKVLQLTKRQKSVVFIQKIILPYLHTKLDNIFDNLNKRVLLTNESHDLSWHERLFLRFYLLIKRFISILDLLVKLQFLMGQNGSVSILDYLFKIEYTRMALPMDSNDNGSSKISHSTYNRRPRSNKVSMISNIYRILSIVKKITLWSGSSLFPSFIFMLKVYQWWNAENLSMKLSKNLNSLDKDVPKSAYISKKAKEGQNVDGNICPICHDIVQNPCIIETGCIACYPCTVEYLKTHEGHCPVTGNKLLGCQFNKAKNEWEILDGIRRLLI